MSEHQKWRETFLSILIQQHRGRGWTDHM